MQGVGNNNIKSTVIVIAATNKPWQIDSAFLRPGRFDEKIYVPLPDEKARVKMFELYLKDIPVENDLDIDYLVEITDGFNGADIKEVCEKLKMVAINEMIETKNDIKIGMKHVEIIKDKIVSSVSLEDIENLEEFEERFQ